MIHSKCNSVSSNVKFPDLLLPPFGNHKSVVYESVSVFFFFNILFIWPHKVLIAAHRTFGLHCTMRMEVLSCSMWDLVP